MPDWTTVCPDEELKEGEHKIVDVDNVMVAVFRLEGDLIAIEDACPHDGSEIASGCIKKGIIECPRHGATFNLRNGDVLTPPAYEPLEMMETEVEAGVIKVRDARWD